MKKKFFKGYHIWDTRTMLVSQRTYKKDFEPWIKDMFIITQTIDHRKWYDPFSWFKIYYVLRYKGEY